MRILLPLVLLLALAASAKAQASADSDAAALALRSQQLLNEYSIGAAEPEAMKYAQRLRLTRATLDRQFEKWPVAGAAGAASAEKFSACKSALQTASALAGLSGQKAIRSVDEALFQTEKARLQELRVECAAQLKRAGVATR